MPKLYVANLSKQNHQFLYSIPTKKDSKENLGHRTTDIPMGQQRQIDSSDLQQWQIDAIVSHHQNYGMKSVAEARQIKGYTGMVYSDKPIDVNESGFVEEVTKESGDTLNEAVNKRREATTAAISQNLSAIGEQSGAPLQRTEVEQQEDTTGTPQVAVGVETVAQGVEPRNTNARRSK